jgi:xylitol oxidase
MDKRQFLKTTSAAVAGTLLSRYASAESGAQAQESVPATNWAGNLEYHAEQYYQPRSVAELQSMVRQLASIRALGSRHSFNTIADTTASQINLAKFDSIEIHEKAHTVTVGAGVRYGTLAPVIDKKGFAVHNLASLPHITVAGAISTATHGSGINNGNLATAVSAIEFVNANGDLVTLSRKKDGPAFLGAVVGLGCIGILTKVTLDVLPRLRRSWARATA